MMPLFPVQFVVGEKNDRRRTALAKGILKMTRNLCDVALIVLEQGKDELMPTVLELMHVETQRLIDDYCIVEKE
ncbi:hypothetical protein LCGC14_1664830 [marine sediment metagenome]|uniref:Uncharacterized protein n=1 Tax=marine sediment metagenome TaxID=412755 RepID=A0A0F9K8W8_9ZZZZ